MRYTCLILCLIILAACEGPEPRKPVSVQSGSFMKTSVERNRQLLAGEVALIESLIKADSLNTYFPTGAGSWYHYNTVNAAETYTPQPQDKVQLTYDLLNLANDTLYSREEIGIINYLVDQQELFPGLRHGIKLLKKNETATFLIPSSLAYGYHGDNDKIGPNIPVRAVVTIFNIEPKEKTN